MPSMASATSCSNRSCDTSTIDRGSYPEAVTAPRYCWRVDAPGLLDDLNEAQREAVTSELAPLCILAGAGSGKTRVLTRRIAHRVAIASAEPHRVLALTFTRKA